MKQEEERRRRAGKAKEMGVLSPRTRTRGSQRIPVSVPGLRRTSELKACILGTGSAPSLGDWLQWQQD